MRRISRRVRSMPAPGAATAATGSTSRSRRDEVARAMDAAHVALARARELSHEHARLRRDRVAPGRAGAAW